MTTKANPYVTGKERQKDEIRAFRLGLISYRYVKGAGFVAHAITPKPGQRLTWEAGTGIIEVKAG